MVSCYERSPAAPFTPYYGRNLRALVQSLASDMFLDVERLRSFGAKGAPQDDSCANSERI